MDIYFSSFLSASSPCCPSPLWLSLPRLYFFSDYLQLLKFQSLSFEASLLYYSICSPSSQLPFPCQTDLSTQLHLDFLSPILHPLGLVTLDILLRPPKSDPVVLSVSAYLRLNKGRHCADVLSILSASAPSHYDPSNDTLQVNYFVLGELAHLLGVSQRVEVVILPFSISRPTCLSVHLNLSGFSDLNIVNDSTVASARCPDSLASAVLSELALSMWGGANINLPVRQFKKVELSCKQASQVPHYARFINWFKRSAANGAPRLRGHFRSLISSSTEHHLFQRCSESLWNDPLHSNFDEVTQGYLLDLAHAFNSRSQGDAARQGRSTDRCVNTRPQFNNPYQAFHHPSGDISYLHLLADLFPHQMPVTEIKISHLGTENCQLKVGNVYESSDQLPCLVDKRGFSPHDGSFDVCRLPLRLVAEVIRDIATQTTGTESA